MPTNGNRPLKLQFGLINYESLYLTAEAFGFKLNASAPSLKRKQMWTLEQDPEEPQVVYLQSHLGRYLASDADGHVTCEAASRSPDSRFLLLPQPDGRWALQSHAHRRFLAGSRDFLSCFAQALSEEGQWAAQLALHPHVCLRSVARRRYAHLAPAEEGGGGLVVERSLPWGVEALLTLAYTQGGPRGAQGAYRLQACDGRTLAGDGRLVEVGGGAAYTLELRGGHLAFREAEGRYLQPVGPGGALRSGRCSRPGKDELFDLEEVHPQVVLRAGSSRLVSIRQGVSLSANQEEETDMETFQMEIDRDSRMCAFRSCHGLYWSLVTHGAIQVTATEVSENTMFALEWFGHRVALRASNGKYVCTKKNGQLAAVSDSVGEDEQLTPKLVNRPMLILKGKNGFVCHHKGSNTLDSGRSVYDVFTLSCTNGAYHIKGVSGGFWYVNSAGLVCADGATPEDFCLEFPERGRLVVRTQSGRYVRGDQGGLLKGDGLSPDSAALWEY